WQYLFPLAAAATVAALHLARGRIGSGPLVAVLCYVATLAPALGFVNVYPMRYSFVADHFQYLASLPLIALAAAGATRLPRPQVIGAGVLLVLGALAWRQGLVYRDAETVWRDTLAKDPDSGRLEDAAAHYREAIREKPGYADPHSNLGNVLAATERLADATAEYEAALRLDPGYADAHANLAAVLAAQGDLDGAIAHYQA